jgi:hypothetical protein
VGLQERRPTVVEAQRFSSSDEEMAGTVADLTMKILTSKWVVVVNVSSGQVLHGLGRQYECEPCSKEWRLLVSWPLTFCATLRVMRGRPVAWKTSSRLRDVCARRRGLSLGGRDAGACGHRGRAYRGAESLARTAECLEAMRPAVEWMDAEQAAAYLADRSRYSFNKVAPSFPKHYLTERRPPYDRREIDECLMGRR